MNRRIGLTALAVVLALIGAGTVYIYAHGADRRAAESLSATSVLIVQKAIPVGTAWQDVVKDGYATRDDVPKASAPTAALSSLQANVPNREVATFAIAPGQILVRQMFGTPSPRTGALRVPNHLQALSVALTMDADVAGFVQNGSDVAIYSTFKLVGQNPGNRSTAGGADAFATKLLIPRVTVLAVSHPATSTVSGATTGGSGLASSSNSSTSKVLVTLAVDQTSAQRIVLAQQVGTLYLSLLTSNSDSVENGGTINFGRFSPSPVFAR